MRVDKVWWGNEVHLPSGFQKVMYNGNLKSGHVRFSNGQSLSGFRIVQILNGSYTETVFNINKNLIYI